jgi:predicted CopG family antitoxin
MEEVKQVVNEIINNVEIGILKQECSKLINENKKNKKEIEYLTIKLKDEVAMWKKQWEEMRDQENETSKAFREEKADRRKAEKEKEEIEGCLEAIITERDKAYDDINKLKDGNKQLNDVYEELKKENKKNDLLKMVEGFCYLSDHNCDLVLDMLKNETDDEKLIKSVFDEWYATTFYYDIEKDKIITVDGSDDDE